jgi:hypothetical protein
MISNIHTTSPYITVSGGMSNTYVNGYSGAQGVGNMRYNTSMQKIEVFDGNNWIQLNMGIQGIGLTGEAESLLNWAAKKRNEELEIESLAKDNPAIKDLVDQIKEKQHQVKMIKTLIESPGYDAIKPSMVP